jgi:hypothetical protein
MDGISNGVDKLTGIYAKMSSIAGIGTFKGKSGFKVQIKGKSSSSSSSSSSVVPKFLRDMA